MEEYLQDVCETAVVLTVQWLLPQHCLCTRTKEAVKEKRTQACILITREAQGGGS